VRRHLFFYGVLFGALMLIALLAEVIRSVRSFSTDSPLPLVIAVLVVVLLPIRRALPKDPLERRHFTGEDWADTHPIGSSLIPVALIFPLALFSLRTDEEFGYSWLGAIGWATTAAAATFAFLIGIWAVTRIVRTRRARRAGIRTRPTSTSRVRGRDGSRAPPRSCSSSSSPFLCSSR